MRRLVTQAGRTPKLVLKAVSGTPIPPQDLGGKGGKKEKKGGNRGQEEKEKKKAGGKGKGEGGEEWGGKSRGAAIFLPRGVVGSNGSRAFSAAASLKESEARSLHPGFRNTALDLASDTRAFHRPAPGFRRLMAAPDSDHVDHPQVLLCRTRALRREIRVCAG